MELKLKFMLDPKIVSKIEDFVYLKPRTIQEIAQLINRNWRTADRYVEEISTEYGTIAVRVFRGGTKGALKIVYWASVEKASSSVFQESIENDIMNSKKKEDFSAFDIFQHVPDKKRSCFVTTEEYNNIEEFSKLLLNAKKQILYFSGNLSIINLKNKNKDMFDTFEKLIKKRIKIKILSRVDLAGMDNIQKLLSLNKKYGEVMVEIRHNLHPLRGAIIDGKFIRLKEVKEPTGKINELNKRMFIFYNINDKSWAEWLSRIFWKKFSNSIDANKRLEHMKNILHKKMEKGS
ncbi:hypothetical protein D6777_00855 [Candidatus Woesearchaeota archaeon]|nr:MAG: hypothetical protein D6777_00855 [Candidatus Woesearchaeota archaeon]